MEVTLGGIAGLVAALAFAYLVGPGRRARREGGPDPRRDPRQRADDDRQRPAHPQEPHRHRRPHQRPADPGRRDHELGLDDDDQRLRAHLGVRGDGRLAAHQGRGLQLRRAHGRPGPAEGDPREAPAGPARRRGGRGRLRVWRMPATRRFVATVREAATEREAELREAVEVAVREDATDPGPAARGRRPRARPRRRRGLGRPRRRADARATRPSADEARELLLDPRAARTPTAGELARGAAPAPHAHPLPCAARPTMSACPRTARPQD